MAEPSVGLWRPKWRREGQDPPPLRIQELEPSPLPVEDNPHAENEVGMNLWDVSSFAALPANSTPQQNGGVLEHPRQTQETHHLNGDAKCAETAATYSISAALYSLTIVHFGLTFSIFRVSLLQGKEVV